VRVRIYAVLIKGIFGISAVADSRRPLKVKGKSKQKYFYPLLFNFERGALHKSCGRNISKILLGHE
jgi:hypothetical protein